MRHERTSSESRYGVKLGVDGVTGLAFTGGSSSLKTVMELLLLCPTGAALSFTASSSRNTSIELFVFAFFASPSSSSRNTVIELFPFLSFAASPSAGSRKAAIEPLSFSLIAGPIPFPSVGPSSSLKTAIAPFAFLSFIAPPSSSRKTVIELFPFPFLGAEPPLPLSSAGASSSRNT